MSLDGQYLKSTFQLLRTDINKCIIFVIKQTSKSRLNYIYADIQKKYNLMNSIYLKLCIGTSKL